MHEKVGEKLAGGLLWMLAYQFFNFPREDVFSTLGSRFRLLLQLREVKSAAKGKKVGLRNCVRGKKQNPPWRNPGTDGLFAIENMFRIVSHSIGFYLNITSNRIGRITFSSFHFFFF